MKPETDAQIAEELTVSEEAGGVTADDAPRTVVPSFYVDPMRWPAERDRIWRRSWSPVARLEELSEDGAFVSVSVGEVPLLILRDGETLRAHHNVCRHRGAVLVRAERGRCGQRLVCPYHLFAYGRDGSLAHLPRPESFPADLDRGALSLHPASVDTWAGWVWVRVCADGPSLGDFLGVDLCDELEGWPLETLRCWARETVRLEVGWKLAVENFMEAWHVPQVHPESVDAWLDIRAHSMRFMGDHSRMVSRWRGDPYGPEGRIGRAAARVGIRPFPELSPVQRTCNFTVHIFPGLTLNFMPNHVTAMCMRPDGAGATLVDYQLLMADVPGPGVEALAASLWQGHRQLMEEDRETMAWHWRGLAAAEGPLVLSAWEARLAYFQDRVAAWLEEAHDDGSRVSC